MLRLPQFRMIEPTTWTAAATLLREHGAGASDVAGGTPSVPVMLVAGGTDLFPNMKRRQFTPRVLASLAQAAGVISTPQLRNMGTIGGNLCLDTRCNWYDQSLFWRTAEGYCMKTHPSVVCRVARSISRSCTARTASATSPSVATTSSSR